MSFSKDARSGGRRHPKSYDGPKKTTWLLSDLAEVVVRKVTQQSEQRTDLIFAAWADMMGPDRASRVEAERFENGILYVRVKNSLLYSLLRTNEKRILLNELRRRFPRVQIDQIILRMG